MYMDERREELRKRELADIKVEIWCRERSSEKEEEKGDAKWKKKDEER